MVALRPIVIGLGLLVLWQAVVMATGVAHFILPAPADVLALWWQRLDILLGHAAVTLAEMLMGLALGTACGTASALFMAYFRPARQWLMPILVVSQAVPVFALAPLLVLWFGYGMAPKVVMATLIIYFPVTAAFHDGLRRTDLGWLDLAHTMDASPWAVLRHVRLPAALPALASGLRVAAAVAPIGAIVGEWVGASGRAWPLHADHAWPHPDRRRVRRLVHPGHHGRDALFRHRLGAPACPALAAGERSQRDEAREMRPAR